MFRKRNNTFHRIMIFGIPGSGKSTFSLKLSRQLYLPLYHLDKYFFVENWIEKDKQEFLTIQQALVDQEKWIIDGNAIRSLEMRYKRADVVIYMCFPRLLCIFRTLKRLFSKDPAIYDRAPNCPERVSWKFLKYLWQFDKRIRPVLKELQKIYPTISFYKIQSDKELRELWKRLFLTS